jgi:hypothetical protein
VNGRGLTRAIRTKDAENLTFPDFERDVVDGRERSKAFGQILDFNNSDCRSARESEEGAVTLLRRFKPSQSF